MSNPETSAPETSAFKIFEKGGGGCSNAQRMGRNTRIYKTNVGKFG